MEYVIGFDLGGTRLKSGAVSKGGRVYAAGIQPSGYHMVPKTLLKTYVKEVERISKEMGEKPQAVGLAFSGAVHPRKGVVYLPGKVKGLEGYPIVEEMEKRLGVPVIAETTVVSLFMRKLRLVRQKIASGQLPLPWGLVLAPA